MTSISVLRCFCLLVSITFLSLNQAVIDKFVECLNSVVGALYVASSLVHHISTYLSMNEDLIGLSIGLVPHGAVGAG